MSVINTQPLVGASGQSTGGYTIAKSLRFRRSASAYLNRTPGTAGNRQKWTWSGWVKRGLSGSANQKLFSVFNGNNDNQLFEITIFNDKLYIEGYTVYWRISTQVLRDHSSWYHIVCAVDTTLSTANDRIKVYINGTQITAFDTTNNPTQNADTAINQTAAHHIGSRTASSDFLDAYLADVYLVDGQQLTPSSFGETDSITGVWKPKAYSGTYGTNGFYLKFADATSTSTLGNDSSGNSNTWTTNNISVTAGTTYDSMTDVPTLTSATAANYCVMNPLDLGQTSTLTEGNLRFASSSNANQSICRGSIGVSSGKWYWEVTANSSSTGNGVGIAKSTAAINNYLGSDASGYCYFGNGDKYNNGTGGAYGATFTTNDVIGVALDMDAGTLVFYKNNTSQGTAYSSISGTVFPSVTDGSGGAVSDLTSNFGQRPFSYTPPTGYVALNTYNLSTPTIAAGNKYMDATTYTGTLVSNAITNAGAFKPDLVWVKSRSAATDHKLTDSVRGVTKGLISNTTGAETTDTQGLTAFGTNGFTVGTNTDYNNLTATYVGWQWQAGQGTTSSNTSGSITSTVSVNATAGFSILTYTGNGANATVGHGLGVVPQFIIVKSRSQTGGFFRVYSPVIGAAYSLFLNSTLASTLAATIWNSTTPTSSVFSIGTDSFTNTSGETYVGYCWTPISGFSAFGSYTGNGSTDGPFIYTGFRPKYVLIKRTDTTSDWAVCDSTRNTYNKVTAILFPNTADAEATADIFQFFSNGFKLNQTGAGANASGGTYIYAAFAETPFKYANAF